MKMKGEDMKKFILPIILVLVFGCSCFFIFKQEKSDLKKVKVADVTLT